MISKENVKHIAKLARIDLTEDEIGKFQKELSAILDYIEKLKEVDIEGADPMSHAVAVENVMREDEAGDAPAGQKEKLLQLAPETKEGYLKVKAVLQ